MTELARREEPADLKATPSSTFWPAAIAARSASLSTQIE